ncbi:hypothetical protein [Chengkuizengella axinellae]|uniref:Uncharacterized protein n=1 Tax=Chengkuizengella axinellae TaxID=3064388 RepID=A0ABT9J3S6_9BACL|nr:hypothetical protein [Chengkuizengella sp. 2205SS18-9]MDP5276092.1 hypothetical protein [Chengkuizengella sp. 2205SS18-9]
MKKFIGKLSFLFVIVSLMIPGVSAFAEHDGTDEQLSLEISGSMADLSDMGEYYFTPHNDQQVKIDITLTPLNEVGVTSSLNWVIEDSEGNQVEWADAELHNTLSETQYLNLNADEEYRFVLYTWFDCVEPCGRPDDSAWEFDYNLSITQRSTGITEPDGP